MDCMHIVLCSPSHVHTYTPMSGNCHAKHCGASAACMAITVSSAKVISSRHFKCLRLCFQSGRTEGLSIEPGWNIGIGILASVANKSKKKVIRLKHGGYASMQPCLSTSVAEDVKGPYSFVSSWNLMTMLRRHCTSTLGQAFPANKIKMSLLALKTNEWCPFVPYISAAPVQGFNPVNGNPITSRGTLYTVTDRHPLSRVFVPDAFICLQTPQRHHLRFQKSMNHCALAEQDWTRT